ncbi:P-loop containing nucleoside triphosphate hydrolase protein [Cristinia sonorae]|uniref:P-loop containing nucleoside triphosphate hydrolase protein n=1 Tax=Cristinia sonorae TaxID=1940300 RepID=A0A8K0UFV7_9AGAR|nr:P-loop containing nucleoside triphosphate hydrolase protein [Cristinia sonorae]
MQTRSQRSTVLGKRDSPSESSSSCDTSDEVQLVTPESSPHPKRMRTSSTICDGDWNKENIPPLRIEALNASPSSRATRSLRRTSTVSEVVTTPRATRSLRRYNSMSNVSGDPRTPTSAPPQISLATPPPTPSTLLPISARARALLRATCNNTGGLSGRTAEAATIQCFVRSFLTSSNADEAEHTVLYISGSPGTGKTALVTTVLNDLNPELTAAAVTFVSVNCMALGNVDALWDRLIEVLSDGCAITKTRKGKDSASRTLEKLLQAQRSRCIVLLDELDHLASSAQSLTQLFNLVHQHSSSIRLIGIANTHTLTSTSTSTLSVQSLRHVQTCHFAPYTPEQLLEILQKRLAPLSEQDSLDRSESKDKFLPPATLMLLSKKIAAQTGDVRALFEVLRGAIDLAMVSGTSSNPMAAPTPTISPQHILAALKAHTPSGVAFRSSVIAASSAVNSEIVTKVTNLGLQSRLVLLALTLASRRVNLGLPVSSSPSRTPSTPSKSLKRTTSAPSKSEADALDVNQLYVYYSNILSRSENDIFTPASRSEFGDLVGVLETVGIVSLSSTLGGPSTPSKSGRKPIQRTSSFSAAGNKTVRLAEGIRLEEVSRGLGVDSKPAGGDVRAEEAWAIAESERVRMSKEAKAGGATAQFTAFEGAIEN